MPRDRSVRVYGRAVLPHPDGDTRVTIARAGVRWSLGGSRVQPGPVVLLRLPSAPSARFALAASSLSLASLRRAAHDPRTAPRARRALNRWRRVQRAAGGR